ncbi:MAG: EAL domain-containing protein [Burkholderiales bacterium]|jgi:diguanylate cyclase (GGDEF)-like protein/PAS domain S-box-containing protein
MTRPEKLASQKNNGEVAILIAENSPTQAARLVQLLEQRGYSVSAAANGREALDLLERHKPALVISDIVMPELDGYGLCKAIKADRRLKDIPVMLVTALSDPQDVIRGLESGADNFLRKPYDERCLQSRIDYLLMNLELRRNQKMQMGMEISLAGQKHFVSAERQQILDLLISTYAQAVEISSELRQREKELAHSSEVLNALYRIAEGLNQAGSERQVLETALARALELPGIQAGWISLREGEAGFRLAAASNLPPSLELPGAMEGDCACRRRLISGELDHVTNIMECERLGRAKGDTRGLRYHASVPLWLGDRTLGVMNLVGPDKGLFNDDELRVLYGIGNQVAVALERAHLHEHLEYLVEEKTAKLAAEVEQRKRIQEQQARLTAILEATPDFVATGDLDGRVLYMNPAGLRMIGHEPGQDVSVLPVGAGHPDWALKLVTETGIPQAIEHGSWSGETAFLRRDGLEVPVSQVIVAHKGESGSVEYLSTVARDITLRKDYEKRITRLNRVHAVLSGINTTIVRTRNRQQLFEDACRIAVEQGRFRLAWVGLLDANGADVTLVAKAGVEEGYLDNIRLTSREDAQNRCELVARVLRENTAAVCNDIDIDPQMARWREQALRRGYRSVVVLPLQLEDKVAGLLLLYASEAGFFDTEEMRLLAEIAGDISFALDHLNKEERLNYLAYYDALTGLPNRSLLHDRLDQRVALANGEHKRFALIVLNLERFRSVNETLGQHAGDDLLRQVAQRLKDALDESDILARLGADSFAIVTRRSDDDGGVVHAVEHVLSRIHSQPFELGGQELRAAAKAGVAIFPHDGGDPDALSRNAEAALGKAKRSGDRYLFYAPEFNARVAEKLTLENKLRRAVEQGELALYYQPKVELKKRRVSGMEALMRWNDPESGLVPPFQFISILEETGLILDAGRWALEQAVADAARWKGNGVHAKRVAVNVSAIQLRQKDFVATVERALGVAGEGILELEITESLIMQDIDATIGKLRAVRDMGVEIAVDDFGTGYSSLSYISRLPINTLKIDRAFIKNMASKPDALSIVSTIISLGHSLELKVVAEGVETEEQANLLRLLKCDEFQGYLFSRPVPAEQIAVLLQEHKSLPKSLN